MAVKKCWAVFHNDPASVQSGSSGYSILGKKGIDHLYINEDAALDLANEIASKNPGTQVIVLEAKIIVEAKIPDTVSKAWRDNGELLPIERPARKKEKSVRYVMDDIARQLDEGRPMPARVAREVRVGGLQFAQQIPPQGEVVGDPIPAHLMPDRERF